MKRLNLRDVLKSYAPLVILLVIFASALWLRSFPARFGELQALDPFFFYRMGVEAMQNNWELGVDEMRYHPTGVETTQYHYLVPIYFPAFVYTFLTMLGMNMHYLHFAILWPAVFGALAVVAMYFLGSEIFSSRKAGLFAAFFLATVPAFITRTSAGFFEKEPIAGLFIITSVYFFVKAFRKSSWLNGILAGLSLAFTSLAWGGVQYIYILYGGFLGLVFLANGLVVVLDYLFSGFGGFMKTLNRYLSIDMVKAYLPLMLLGIFIQQPLTRKIPLDSISVIISITMLGILMTRYGIERFSLVKRDYMPYVVPAILVLLFSGALVGSMFSDSVARNFSAVTGYLTFSKSVVGTTVAENAPGNWDNIASTTGTGFATALVPQLGSIAPYLALWVFMFLGTGLLLYRFYRTHDWMMLFPVIWLASGIFGVFYYVRLIYLVGPPAALAGGFFMAWVIDFIIRKANIKPSQIGLKDPLYQLMCLLLVIIFVTLVVGVNLASAYTYSLNLGPSICFPRYNSDNPFDVQPCVTIGENGEEILAPNQPWYEAFTYLANETPQGSSILSWWDFGYWFQVRGERPSIADGGNLGGDYGRTDREIARWFTDDVSNWGNHTEWLMEEREVDYILMDYTLPGKYGAISKIASDGEQIVGFLQFSQKGIEPRGNESVYIFSNGPVYSENIGAYIFYEIWLPLNQDGNLAGTPMFLIKRQDNDQYLQKSYINDVCTRSGIIRAGDESPAIPGCVSISDLGIYYVPPEAENTIFTDLMFMEGTGLPVEKVFDNQLVKIYKVSYGEASGGDSVSGDEAFDLEEAFVSGMS
jgi:dolichyl-diphosphooligosaccharide--protein glycosyltransferase